MIGILGYLIVLFGILFLLLRGVRALRSGVSRTVLIREYIVVVVYLLTNICYILYALSTEPYYQQIDPLDVDYEFLAKDYILPMALFYVFFLVSLFLVWTKGWKLPPVVILLCNCFLLIGIFISVKTIVHCTQNKESGSGLLLALLPVMNIVLAISFIVKLMLSENKHAQDRTYRNIFLNKINSFLSKSSNLYLAIVVLAFPIYYLIMLILILFGQNPDSMTKVFTETTNWAFSQKQHPPYLDHNGHYLCTVAACGTPALVKPLFLGIRHNQKIIVNRQLQIANAFEEIIRIRYPKMHGWIRNIYDKYGYNLSRKINSSYYSNLTYIMMKPLETAFLLFIYSVKDEPEKLIRKQYSM